MPKTEVLHEQSAWARGHWLLGARGIALERNSLWLSIDQDIAARTPVDFLLATASSYVVFPAPDAPIKAVNCPGLTNP